MSLSTLSARACPTSLTTRAPCLLHIRAHQMSRAAEAYYEHKARETEESDERAKRPGRRQTFNQPSSNLLQRYSGILDDRTASIRDLEYGEPLIHFEVLGLHKPIVDATHAAFPHVTHPTEMQTRLIPAILSGKDIILKDDTGTGKTFGAMLALLSKPRTKYRVRNAQGRTIEKDTVTSLMIVPYRDLAYQILNWIESIVKNFGGASPPELSSIAQVLVRDGQMHLGEGLETLRNKPPHILIGTPQALLDVYREDPNAFRCSALSTVFVDEVDYLVETVRDLGPEQSNKRRALERRIRKHPGPTRELLDIIYEDRIRRNAELLESEYEHDDEAGGASKRETIGGPQLVLASATLPGHLSSYVFGQSGWFARHDYVRITKSKDDSSSASKTMGLGGTGVEHSVILVGPNSATNIPGAEPSTQATELPSVLSEDDSEQALDEDVLSKEEKRGFAGKRSPYNPDVMEAIATAFALDVPSVALLVLPTSANVKRAVYDLRELGVNARPLDLAQQRGLLTGTQEARSNPMMLVSTFSAIRGLDLPDLTHVFILGVLEREIVPRATDAYVHIAGRVGRSGRGGKVLSFIETTEADGATYDPDAAPKEKAAARQGDLWRLQRVLKRLSLRPRAFPHFDDVEYEEEV